ncbi:MAG: PHP domain-containing protein, partial [Actinomycetota bacterium]
MPDALVARAAEHGQRVLALTDRDGVYGAVRFVRACAQAGVDCVLGVDLALDLSYVDGVGRPLPPVARPPDEGALRAPVRGGAWVDPRHPRAVLLARGKRGWASLCRLLTAVHEARGDDTRSDARSGTRSDARSDARAVAATFDQIAAHSEGVVAAG